MRMFIVGILMLAAGAAFPDDNSFTAEWEREPNTSFFSLMQGGFHVVSVTVDNQPDKEGGYTSTVFWLQKDTAFYKCNEDNATTLKPYKSISLLGCFRLTQPYTYSIRKPKP